MNSSTSNSKNKLRQYTLGTLLLVLFTLLFDRGLFLMINAWESAHYQKSGFEKQFGKYIRNHDYNTIIFGTSRAYEGIHPVYLRKHLNIEALKEAYQGRGPKNNLYFYRLYKKYRGAPKVVIYGVDYFIYTVESTTQWLSRFDVPASDRKNPGFFSTPLLLLRYKHRMDIFLNDLLADLDLNKEAEDSPIRHMSTLQEYVGGPHDPKKVISQAPARRYRRQLFPRPPGAEGKYFFQLLEEMQNDGVTVLFVLLPDYFGTFKTNTERDELVLHLKNLKNRFPNTHVLNYNRPTRFELSKTEYFLDGGYGMTNSHLCDVGARHFNEILCREIKPFYQ